ncbi:hypothetical protein [Nannocystis radixulma]|uniref:Uncharacterized protein n=1 Tax=Nannocystis radixulma TaxID=2995305 RepID=A0ABT5B2T9_9BACT|nr:hypothetical protein [Nannocystis radixulma]MDC0668058.1 hypothetical protein [Nannocystis radixulma]
MPDNCSPIFFVDAENQQTDIESGWVRCEPEPFDFVEYREEAIACAHEVFWPPCEGQDGDCATDADCGGGQVCSLYYNECTCLSDDKCMSDSDCADGEICLCAGKTSGGNQVAFKNRCISAGCAEKDDCMGDCGCRATHFCSDILAAFCPTLADECANNSDCAPTDGCFWDPDQQRWTCQEPAICE